MEKLYKVLKEKLEGDVVFAVEAIGAEVHLIEEVAAPLVAEGYLEEVVTEEKPEVQTEPEVAADPVPETPKQLFVEGKLVLSSTIREVEGKQLHHVKLEDGSERDLTVEEYTAVLEATK